MTEERIRQLKADEWWACYYMDRKKKEVWALLPEGFKELLRRKYARTCEAMERLEKRNPFEHDESAYRINIGQKVLLGELFPKEELNKTERK